MKGKMSIHDHLNDFNSLLTKLLGVGMKIDEEEQDILLICSMSNSWNNLIMSLSHVKELTMDSMVASLLLEELRRKSLESLNSTSSSQELVMEERKGRFKSRV